MTPEERAAKLARAICTCTCYAPGAALDIAAAIREAVKAEREACAKIADKDVSLNTRMLERSSKRYEMRDALKASGYQGDPDAECISFEAAKDTATGIAAAIRARTP